MRRFKPLCLYVDEGYPIAEMFEGTGEYRHESDVIALEQENGRLKAELSQAKADQERFVFLCELNLKNPVSKTAYELDNMLAVCKSIDECRAAIDEQRDKG